MNPRGFTLVETVVVIVLLGTLGLFTFQFIGSSVETFVAVSNQADLLAEAKLSMERMAREIRDAAEISTPASGSSGSSINFIKSHATAIDSATNITFGTSGSTLERKRGKSQPEVLADNVSNFNVSNTSNEIKLELTLSLASGENVALGTKIHPRNLPFASVNFGGAQFAGDWEEVIQ